MRFNSALLAATILLLTACATTPEPEPAVPAQAALTEAPPDAPPGFDFTAPDDNPYLSSAAPVSEAVSREFARAVQAMEQQQWAQAQHILYGLSQEHPHLSGPLLNLGIVHRKLNQNEEATAAFAKAIEVNPLNLDAYNQLALLKREAGDFGAAESFYLQALQVWPKHPASHRNLGILYDLYMGELDKALQHFRIYQYLQAEPDRQVAGWIIDLSRRLEESAPVGGAP